MATGDKRDWKNWHAPLSTIDDLLTVPDYKAACREAMEVFGIVYAQLERGQVEDAMNELREAARRMEVFDAR